MAFIGSNVAADRDRAMQAGLEQAIQSWQGMNEQNLRAAALQRDKDRQDRMEKLQIVTTAPQLGIKPEELQNAMTYDSGLQNLSTTLQGNKNKAEAKAKEEQTYQRGVKAQEMDIKAKEAGLKAGNYAFDQQFKTQELGIQNRKLDLMSNKQDKQEAVGKATQYIAGVSAQKASEANKVMEDLVAKGYDRAAPLTALGARVLPEALKSPEDKLQEQAEQQFLTSVIKKRTGMPGSPEELENARKQFIVQVGDTPAVKEQKRQDRALAIAGLSAEGGTAVAGQIANRAGLPQQPFGQAPQLNQQPQSSTPRMVKHQGILYSVDENGNMTPQ